MHFTDQEKSSDEKAGDWTSLLPGLEKGYMGGIGETSPTLGGKSLSGEEALVPGLAGGGGDSKEEAAVAATTTLSASSLLIITSLTACVCQNGA